VNSIIVGQTKKDYSNLSKKIINKNNGNLIPTYNLVLFRIK